MKMHYEMQIAIIISFHSPVCQWMQLQAVDRRIWHCIQQWQCSSNERY